MLSSCMSQGFLARFVSASQGKMRGVCVWYTYASQCPYQCDQPGTEMWCVQVEQSSPSPHTDGVRIEDLSK